MVDDAAPVTVHVQHLAVPVGGDAIGQIARVDARDRRLTGGIDVHHQEHV